MSRRVRPRGSDVGAGRDTTPVEIAVARRLAAVTDTQITLEAADAIDRAVDVPEESVQLRVHDGVVLLTGTVSSSVEREAAARAVSSLPGVQDVQNLLRIRPEAHTVDLRAAIADALVRSGIVDGDRCLVTADEAGGVTLAGTVESWARRRQAESLVWASDGVTAVDNRLLVEG